MKKIWVIVSVSLAMTMWGSTFVVFKYANESLDPISIIFFRLLVSVVFLFIFARLAGRLQRLDRKDLRWFLLLTLFEPFFYFLGESYGLSMISSTLAAVIVSTIPLVVPVAAWFFYRERLTWMNILGLFISFGGVLMVILANAQDFSANLKGILLEFVAVISAVGYTIVVKRLVNKYNPITITAWQSLIGSVYIFPLFLLVDYPGMDFRQILPESIWAVVYLGIFGSSLAFIFFTIGIRELGAARANIYANLVPVVAAVTAVIFIQEPMPLIKIFGITLVISGLFLSQVNGLLKNKNGKRRWMYRSTV